MSLFPFIKNISSEQTVNMQDFPIFKEYAWDFKTNTFIYDDGKPIVLERNDALKVWIQKCLNTSRYRHIAYSWNYGSEAEVIMGFVPKSSALLKTEIERNIRECLMVNPYIKEVGNFNVSYDGDKLNVEFRVISVYGEVR